MSNDGDGSQTLDDRQEIVKCTERLLGSIINRNFEAFRKLVDPKLTFYEPGTLGSLYYGLEYHKFKFKNKHADGSTSVTMLQPEVKMLSREVGIITFIRLTQATEDDKMVVSRNEETHVWQRKGGSWVNVHFHQSVMATSHFHSSFTSSDTASKKT